MFHILRIVNLLLPHPVCPIYWKYIIPQLEVLKKTKKKKKLHMSRCQESRNGQRDDKKKIQTFQDHDLHLSYGHRGITNQKQQHLVKLAQWNWL